MKAMIDLDFVKYAAASVGEKRQIRVVHKPTGKEKVFKTRTQFYGHYLKKDGGYLAEINKSRTSPFLIEEFEIHDEQIPEPIENVLHSAKVMTEKAIYSSGASSFKAFLGSGDSFRVERSTILKYKGQRESMVKPLYLMEVTEYLRKRFNAEIVTGIENDDRVVIECYNKPDHFVIGIDKDFYGAPVKLYNPNRDEEGIVDCTGFGELWTDNTGKIRGRGAKFLNFQICSGDVSDNYKANSASDKAWGEKSAYNALVASTNHKELWQNTINIYKELYPEPKIVTGWRNDSFEIDWKYMLQENFDLARMLRWEGDDVQTEDIFIKLGLQV